MNEKIAEIFKEASKEYDGASDVFIPDGFIEKFSGILLKEVSQICKTSAVSNLDMDLIRNSSKFKLQELATNSCGKNLSEIILKHFDVK